MRSGLTGMSHQPESCREVCASVLPHVRERCVFAAESLSPSITRLRLENTPSQHE